ncbi:hypothetical protein BU15DRAFT_89949 [Melanogaster broomeanus]|nr:hypothetical protein BU15DRAFT_89949 [Melanogaster broomeanus]
MDLGTLHQQYLSAYILFMIMRTIFEPAQDLEELSQQLDLDISSILVIQQSPVLKSGSLHLAWQYAQSPADHIQFMNMLWVSPEVFQVILGLIEDHPIFYNDSNNSQESVKIQLGVTLYRMGRYGNGASLEDIARFAECSEDEEKEQEKQWMDEHLGFRGTWREGWVMYDGTIVVLYAKPGLNGDAYFTRKSNYGLNLQIGNLPSNLRHLIKQSPTYVFAQSTAWVL